MGQLRLIRGTEWFGRSCDMHVYIDGIKVGSVQHNDYRDFRLPDGVHEIFVEIDVTKSKAIDIEIKNGATAVFRVKMPTIRNNYFDLVIAFFDTKAQISFEAQSTDTRANKF